MTHYSYTPSIVCASRIDFDLEGDTVHNIVFERGCPGNLKAISKLLEGKSVSYIVETLRGNTCGYKKTSCADQLAIAVKKAYDSSLQTL